MQSTYLGWGEYATLQCNPLVQPSLLHKWFSNVNDYPLFEFNSSDPLLLRLLLRIATGTRILEKRFFCPYLYSFLFNHTAASRSPLLTNRYSWNEKPTINNLFSSIFPFFSLLFRYVFVNLLFDFFSAPGNKFHYLKFEWKKEEEEKFNAFLSIYCLKEFSNNYNWNFSSFPSSQTWFSHSLYVNGVQCKTRISFSFSWVAFAAWKLRIMNIIIIRTELDMEMWLSSNEWKWYEHDVYDTGRSIVCGRWVRDINEKWYDMGNGVKSGCVLWDFAIVCNIEINAVTPHVTFYNFNKH